jgi:sugar phosphate isomerase/epimerase
MRTRRDFFKAGSLGSGAIVSAMLRPPASGAAPQGAGRTYAVFTKHFLGLSHDRLADTLAELGVSAIEAPIRPKGHVEPERAVDELPRFVETLRKRGVEIMVLASGINAVDAKQHTEDVLRTARALGIPRFRMDWYRYDLKRPIWDQLEAIKPVLHDLVSLSREIGILPCYQNHSGSNLVGAPVWDMATLMRPYKPTELAWCFDMMHATIEGSLSWPIDVNLIRDHLSVAYFKNFVWAGKGHKDAPLGEGVVGREHVNLLKKTDFSGPLTLHVEYLEGQPRDEDYYTRATAATKRDLAILRSWWA